MAVTCEFICTSGSNSYIPPWEVVVLHIGVGYDTNVQDHTPGRDITIILENLEHCGGKPEGADTEILVTDELMSDLTSSKQIFNVQCKFTRLTPHYLTPQIH